MIFSTTFPEFCKERKIITISIYSASHFATVIKPLMRVVVIDVCISLERLDFTSIVKTVLGSTYLLRWRNFDPFLANLTRYYHNWSLLSSMAKWDSRNLEIRSKSVEQTLIPLVTQVLVDIFKTKTSNFCRRIHTVLQLFALYFTFS